MISRNVMTKAHARLGNEVSAKINRLGRELPTPASASEKLVGTLTHDEQVLLTAICALRTDIELVERLAASGQMLMEYADKFVAYNERLTQMFAKELFGSLFDRFPNLINAKFFIRRDFAVYVS